MSEDFNAAENSKQANKYREHLVRVLEELDDDKQTQVKASVDFLTPYIAKYQGKHNAAYFRVVWLEPFPPFDEYDGQVLNIASEIALHNYKHPDFEISIELR